VSVGDGGQHRLQGGARWQRGDDRDELTGLDRLSTDGEGGQLGALVWGTAYTEATISAALANGLPPP